jgi:ATP-dependent Clp protease adaptor protein ClpS
MSQNSLQFTLTRQCAGALDRMKTMATKNPAKPPINPALPPDSDGVGSVVLERRTQKTQPPQMYQVVMLNDDYTPMEFVVVVIQEFFGKDIEAATQIMLKIHLDGKGVCGVYSRDVAATKVDQVLDAAAKAGHPLKCVSEPVGL